MSDWNVHLRVERAIWVVLETNLVTFFEDICSYLYHCVERVCANEGVVLETVLRVECIRSYSYVTLLFVLPPLGQFPNGTRFHIRECLRRFLVNYILQAVDVQVGEWSSLLLPRILRAIS